MATRRKTRMITEKQRELIENNIGLAKYTAKKFHTMHLEMDDIYSAAYLGLIKAAEKFDEGRAISFSTFAIRVMENEIKMLWRRERKYDTLCYLDTPMNTDQGEGTFKDTIPDPFNRYLWPEQLFDMQRGVIQLKRNERRLLNLLIENPELTQKECAERLNRSQPHVSRLLKGIREKLRQ